MLPVASSFWMASTDRWVRQEVVSRGGRITDGKWQLK